MNNLIKNIFNSKWEKKFFNFYHKFFSLKEIENSTGLIWVWGTLLLSYFVSFSAWAIHPTAMTKMGVSSGQYSCWDYYQSCGRWHIFDALPLGYSQTSFYMGIFGILVLIIVLLKKREYILAHILTSLLFIWHFLNLFILTSAFVGNYEYFVFVFGLIFLFIPHKEWFLKLSLVAFYFLASTLKLNDGWILGTYFTSMFTGAPLAPDWFVPIATNLTILAQMVFAWFIFSKNKILRNIMVVYFLFFHLYSGILVGYKYPSVVVPIFVVLYILYYRWQKPPLDKKSIIGWSLIFMMLIIQMIKIWIPGDVRMTMEGNKYGLYMFEANHQCVSTIEIENKDGKKIKMRAKSESARSRCDPYKYWWKIKKQYCVKLEVKKIAWTFDHSINGEPFYRIVDSNNICNLEYQAGEHNKWIKLKKDKPEIVGYPYKNWYK